MIQKSVFKEYSDKYGKVAAYAVFAYKIVRRTLTNLYADFLRKTASLDKEAIVFSSLPDYSDNSRALSEYMDASGYMDKYKVYWLVYDVEACRKRYPDAKVTFIPRFGAFKEFPLSSVRKCITAGCLVATHEFEFPKSKCISGQRYIRLWHGCGYKDNETSLVGSEIFDVHLVPGPLFVKTKSRFWHTDESFFLPAGLPRFDWLLEKNDKAQRMVDSLKGGCHSLVIWMPTFRNARRGSHKEDSISQFPLLSSPGQWKSLDEQCRRNDVMLLVKLHIFQKDYDIPFDSFTNIRSLSNEDFEQAGVKMYNFIALTDGLISDYSSIAVDYLLVDKPMAFALDDFEMYRKVRGFVFDDPREYMPGHHLYDNHQLEAFIADVASGKDEFAAQRHAVMQEAVVKSDCYCRDIMTALGL